MSGYFLRDGVIVELSCFNPGLDYSIYVFN